MLSGQLIADEALHEIVAQHGKMSADQASDYAKQLATDSRYQRDF